MQQFLRCLKLFDAVGVQPLLLPHQFVLGALLRNLALYSFEFDLVALLLLGDRLLQLLVLSRQLDDLELLLFHSGRLSSH